MNLRYLLAIGIVLVLFVGCAGIGASSDPFPKPVLSEKKEVTLDFLNADWCPHCQKMKPYVLDLMNTLPSDRFLVKSWNEKNIQTDPDTATVYNQYTDNGFFTGYPTFVINGNDSRVGEMTQSDLKAWVCSKFAKPVPQACAS